MEQLKDGTAIFDLIDNKSLNELKGKYLNGDVIGLRVHGLIGDCIKASTVLSELIKENPFRKYVFLLSYNDQSKKDLAKDLFTDLIDKGIIVGLYFNEYMTVGNMSYYQYEFLREIGCSRILDLYYYSSEAYKYLKKGIAFLGFKQPLPKNNKIALFRYSGFHKHVPLRHIAEEKWLEIEEHLLKLGLEVCLYGYDDEMKTNVSKENDYRKRLSVLGTIKHASDAGLCISTTTYLPLYLHHFVPCLTYIDPIDTVPINLQWRSNHNYITINTQLPDYVDWVKQYVGMWFMYNKGAELLIHGLGKEIVKKEDWVMKEILKKED